MLHERCCKHALHRTDILAAGIGRTLMGGGQANAVAAFTVDGVSDGGKLANAASAAMRIGNPADASKPRPLSRFARSFFARMSRTESVPSGQPSWRAAS